MTQAGCFLWTILLFLLLCGGGIFAQVRRGAGWFGMATGVTAWLALLSAYLLLLVLYDRIRRHRFPNRVPDPWWAFPLVLACFAGSAFAAVALYRRAFP